VKIFISFDMEGVAGIVDWSQCQPSGGVAYERGCALLLARSTRRSTARWPGAPTEIVLNDSHGTMFNLDPGASATGDATCRGGTSRAT
jgi:D-amino peptidase